MNFVQTVEADAQAAIAAVKAGLTHLEDEGKAVLAWVEKECPSAAGAIAAFMKEADADAAELAKIAANGLSAEIAAGSDAMQTWLLNLIQATHIGTNAQGALKAIDVSAGALVKTIGQNLVSTGLAQILAKLATVAVAAA